VREHRAEEPLARLEAQGVGRGHERPVIRAHGWSLRIGVKRPQGRADQRLAFPKKDVSDCPAEVLEDDLDAGLERRFTRARHVRRGRDRVEELHGVRLLAKRTLDLLVRGHVVGHHHAGDDGTGGIPHRRSAQLESTTIAAHLELATSTRQRVSVEGEAPLAVLAGRQLVDGAPHDELPREAEVLEHVLSLGHDEAQIMIEHRDRDVGQALDERAVSAFALGARQLGIADLRDVPTDAHRADDRTVAVHQRRRIEQVARRRGLSDLAQDELQVTHALAPTGPRRRRGLHARGRAIGQEEAVVRDALHAGGLMTARRLVRQEDLTVEPGDEDRVFDGLDHRGQEALLLLAGPLDDRHAADQPPEIQLGDQAPGELLHVLHVPFGPVAGLLVGQAQDAQHLIVEDDRNPEVGRDAKLGHGKVVPDERVDPGVGDHQWLARADDMLAHGVRERSFAARGQLADAARALDEDAVVIDEREERHRRADELLGQPGQAVEALLRSAIEQVRLGQGGESRRRL